METPTARLTAWVSNDPTMWEFRQGARLHAWIDVELVPGKEPHQSGFELDVPAEWLADAIREGNDPATMQALINRVVNLIQNAKTVLTPVQAGALLIAILNDPINEGHGVSMYPGSHPLDFEDTFSTRFITCENCSSCGAVFELQGTEPGRFICECGQTERVSAALMCDYGLTLATLNAAIVSPTILRDHLRTMGHVKDEVGHFTFITCPGGGSAYVRSLPTMPALDEHVAMFRTDVGLYACHVCNEALVTAAEASRESIPVEDVRTYVLGSALQLAQRFGIDPKALANSSAPSGPRVATRHHVQQAWNRYIAQTGHAG